MLNVMQQSSEPHLQKKPQRRFGCLVVTISLSAGVAYFLYSHSTLAEKAPLQALRDHLDPDNADIGWDLVDGYWRLSYRSQKATDKTVTESMPFVSALPTHTPINAFDYSRSFIIQLNDTQISDAGVNVLSQLPIVYFVATDTSISDSSIDILEQQPNLAWLTLYGTDVSAQRVDRFAKQHPGCHVDYKP
ncbi:MAG: hypothetical protein ABJZ55_07180 [Fuerstiella sp.]